ncbi:MAG: secretin N-terminal domain-containing protein [Kiritimatiellia bacterium]
MKKVFRVAMAFALLGLAGRAFAQSPLLQRSAARRGLLRPGAAADARQGNAPAAGGNEAKTTEDQLKEAMGEKGTNGVPTRLAFDKAPVDLLLYAYADVAGKILLPSPNLPKTEITLKTWDDRELTKEEYLEAIEVALTMHGVVIEPFDRIFLRAFERKSVRTQGIRTAMNVETNGIPEKGRVISQLIRLNHITAEEGQKALEGFKAPEGLFQVFERNNSILVTDTQENINRMLEIVKELDVANPVMEDVFTRQIQFAVASEIKTALETIVTESQKDASQQAKSGPKESGAPGFSSRVSQPQPSRLLNLNRPGANRAEPAPVVANKTMMAQVSDADRGMIRGKVLILADDRSNKLIVITAKTNMDFFDKVIETLDVETTPEVSVEVIRLKYADAEEVASMLNDLIGNNGSSQAKNNQNANAARNGTANRNLTTGARTGTAGTASRSPTANPTFSKSAASALGELNKDNIKILDDKRINGIVVMARKADMKAVKEVIEDMDVKLSQVLIETVIIQVELGDDLQTGIDWVQRGRQRISEPLRDADGNALYRYDDSVTGKTVTGPLGETVDDIVIPSTASSSGLTPLMRSFVSRDGFINNGSYMLGGGGGSSTSKLGSLMQVAVDGATNASSVTSNPIGGGINYLLKSDKLNIAAVIQASQSDSRTKVLASPILMTVDNKEATIEATDMIYLFSGYQYSGSANYGSQVRNYEKRDIGLTVKVTPKINPNGTVMLTVEETFETQGADQNVPNESGGTDPYATVTTRKISSDVSVENRQTVVMGGLTKKTNTESESGIPILKDIPWIGKWLFGSVTQTEKRSELLVFMTPYVLDDADAAQTEALRRKKALSDPRPWEDHGWSTSPLADPVNKKEQLRRLNDEWRKQDEERQNQKAIEEAKMKRARKLAEMDADDRKEWAEKHQKEIDAELERFNDEQKDLREIVDSIRRRHQDAVEIPAVEPGDGPAQPAAAEAPAADKR